MPPEKLAQSFFCSVTSAGAQTPALLSPPLCGLMHFLSLQQQKKMRPGKVLEAGDTLRSPPGGSVLSPVSDDQEKSGTVDTTPSLMTEGVRSS